MKEPEAHGKSRGVGRLRDERGQWGIICLLISVVIGVVLVITFIGPRMSSQVPGDEHKSLPARAMDRGHDVECESNLRSIRQAVDIYNSQNEGYPASTSEIDLGVSDRTSYFKCAVGGEDYIYDPQTGSIRCPHPGHERF
jgi:hypothetical protein